MMEFISIPLVVTIVTLGIYKLFELFVCKKERLAIIEKMGDKFSPNMLEHKINFSSLENFSFSALKVGCLLMGMGLGLLIGYILCVTTVVGYQDQPREVWKYHTMTSLIYGACVLLFGGLGLVAAFIAEIKLNKK